MRLIQKFSLAAAAIVTFGVTPLAAQDAVPAEDEYVESPFVELGLPKTQNLQCALSVMTYLFYKGEDGSVDADYYLAIAGFWANQGYDEASDDNRPLDAVEREFAAKMGQMFQDFASADTPEKLDAFWQPYEADFQDCLAKYEAAVESLETENEPAETE